MFQLNEQQIDVLYTRIATSGLTEADLINDLLDHYCCFIENEMENGGDFETAYVQAYKAITPNGALEIQEELFFLLTFNKQLNMKRILYLSGFVAAFCISTGILLRSLHWLGAREFLLTGFSALHITVLVICTNGIRHFGKHLPAYNLRVLTGGMSGIIISVGNIFKLLSYPGANMLIVAGMALFILFFLPLFFYQLYKESISSLR